VTHVEGGSYIEIALVIGRPVNTVKTLMLRARKQLGAPRFASVALRA